jgi:hypothetical protein
MSIITAGSDSRPSANLDGIKGIGRERRSQVPSIADPSLTERGREVFVSCCFWINLLGFPTFRIDDFSDSDLKFENRDLLVCDIEGLLSKFEILSFAVDQENFASALSTLFFSSLRWTFGFPCFEGVI